MNFDGPTLDLEPLSAASGTAFPSPDAYASMDRLKRGGKRPAAAFEIAVGDGWTPIQGVTGIREETLMKTKIHILIASFVVATVALMGGMGSARADAWFELSSQTIKSADPSVSIKSQGGRWDKDVKKVKLSAEGADVEITNLVLEWDNRKDDTMANVGTIKAGGQTAEHDAPGRKGRLLGVVINYKILGGAPTATLKVWGYD